MLGTGKVLIVTPFFKPNIGGAETFAEDFAKALSKKSVVHICTIKWNKPMIWRGMNFWKALYLIRRMVIPLMKMTRKNKYEKIYALGLIPTFLCSVLNIKFSSVILALYDFKKPGWFTHFLNKADKVYVEGEHGRKDMLAVGVDEDRIVKFQHWCDQSRFNFSTRNNERLRVLFIGRPIKIKGKHIIEACQKMTKDIDYEYVESVPYSDLPEYYKRADVVVIPSLYSEGFSKVVIEAASCGCAVIASSNGSLPELVSPFGKCIEPTSVNFKNELERLKNRESLLKIQIKTAIYAQKNFSDKNAEVFL